MLISIIFILQQADNFLTFGCALNFGRKLYNAVKEEMNNIVLMVLGCVVGSGWAMKQKCWGIKEM